MISNKILRDNNWYLKMIIYDRIIQNSFQNNCLYVKYTHMVFIKTNNIIWNKWSRTQNTFAFNGFDIENNPRYV